MISLNSAKGLTLALLLVSSIAHAQLISPPLGIQDEGGSETKPVLTIDCVGDAIACSHSGTTATITADGSGANAAGNNQDVQFNSSGSLGADTGFAYNPTTDTLTAVNATFTNIDGAIIGATTAKDASFTALAVDTDVLVVDPNTNNVGIGTTVAKHKLHIYGSSNIAARIQSTGGYADLRLTGIGGTEWEIWTDITNNGLSFYKTGDSAKMFLADDGNLGIDDESPDAKLEIIDGGADIFHISSAAGNDGDFVTVDTSGNVGIGSTTPGALLEVNGTTGEAITIDMNSDQNFLIFATGATNKWAQYLSGEDLRFYATEGTDGDRVTFTGDGNLGIGDTSPDYLLELSGASAPKFALSDTDMAHGITNNAETDTFFMIDQGNADDGRARLWGFSDGAGVTPLHFLGEFGAANPTDTVPAVWITGAKRSGTGTTNLGASETLLQVSQDDGTTHLLTVLGGGNVGIGDTGPDATLEIVDAGADVFHISSSASGDGDFVTVDTSGNVGIGTTSPSTELELNGASSSVNDPILRIISSGAQTPFYLTSGTGDAYVKGDSGGNFAMGAEGFIAYEAGGFGDSFERMRIATDGDVSIMTNSPGDYGSGRLTVVNTSSGSSTIGLNLVNDASAANTGVSIDFTPNTNIPLARIDAIRTNIGGAGTTDMSISAYDGSALTEVLRIEGDNGNVGIGSTSPTQKLDVNGNITADDATFTSIHTSVAKVVATGSGSIRVPDIAAADDDFSFWVAPGPVTITSAGGHCIGTCTQSAVLSLEDNAGNAMTGNIGLTAAATDATFTTISGTNTLNTGEGLRFDVDNTPSPDATDEMVLIIRYKHNDDSTL